MDSRDYEGEDFEEAKLLASRISKVANAITEPAAPGHDATGGRVGCLTEAVMGMTAALMAISNSLDGIAEAIRDHE